MRRTFPLFFSLLALAPRAQAAFEGPGGLSLDFYADEDASCGTFVDLPPDEAFARLQAQAFFSSYASSFGMEGLLIWASFALDDADGGRFAMFIVDLDLTRTPPDDDTPMDHGAIRARYIEKRGDTILFEGKPHSKDVWIIDIVFDDGEDGGVEGDFAFLFQDPARPGCRALVRGRFITTPSPARLREIFGAPPANTTEGEDYISVGCGAESGCGGGDDYYEDDSGCESDSSGDTGEGCEGDSNSSGCEGDSNSPGCEGTSNSSSNCNSSDCAGDAHAAVAGPRRPSGLRSLGRILPPLAALIFIALNHRRRR